MRVGSSTSVYVELVDSNPLWATLVKPLGWRRVDGGQFVESGKNFFTMNSVSPRPWRFLNRPISTLILSPLRKAVALAIVRS